MLPTDNNKNRIVTVAFPTMSRHWEQLQASIVFQFLRHPPSYQADFGLEHLFPKCISRIEIAEKRRAQQVLKSSWCQVLGVHLRAEVAEEKRALRR